MRVDAVRNGLEYEVTGDEYVSEAVGRLESVEARSVEDGGSYCGRGQIGKQLDGKPRSPCARRSAAGSRLVSWCSK